MSSRRVRMRPALILGAVLLALVLVVAGWWRGAAPDGPTPASSRPSDAAPAPLAAAPHAAAEGRVVELWLRPDGVVRARPDGIELGLARIPPEQARRYDDWVAGGREGAGPAQRSELAEVVEWRRLAGEAQPDGSVRVRVPLAPADRYELRARGEGPLHFYAAAFTAARVPADLHPLVAAGLRVSGAAPGARLLLRRDPVAPADPRWNALLAREAPALLAAYDDAGLPVADGTLLAPLPPGPLEAVLQVKGVEASRHPLALEAGRIATLVLDPLAQAVAGAVSVQLQLELVEAPHGAALPGIAVTWHGERDATQRSDARGEVRFAGVDAQREQRFTLEFPVLGDLPRWPATRALTLVPEAGAASEDGRVRRHRLALTPLQWLQVDAGVPLLPQTRSGRDPYPVFVLQAADGGGWRDVAADHFVPQPRGLAVSLEAPGTYRVLVLDAPWTRRFSAAVDTRESRAPYVAALPTAAGRRVELSVQHAGAALAHAPLHFVAPGLRLPPRVLAADAQGRAVLEQVSADEVWLEVPGYAGQRVDLRRSALAIELQREE